MVFCNWKIFKTLKIYENGFYAREVLAAAFFGKKPIRVKRVPHFHHARIHVGSCRFTSKSSHTTFVQLCCNLSLFLGGSVLDYAVTSGAS